MELTVYIGTAVLTVFWSVWIHNLWSEKAGLREDSGIRFLMIILPSTIFLMITFSGWQGKFFFRIDLIGLLILDAVTIIVAVVMAIFLKVERRRKQMVFKVSLFFYFFLATVIVAGVYLLKAFPFLLVKFSQLVSEGKRIDLSATLWGILNPEKHENDLNRAVDKLFIALLTYVPISVVRFFYSRKQFKRINEELEKMKEEIASLHSERKERQNTF